MEHLQHFALSQDPFQNEPDLRFYFESGCHADAQRRVERGLRQAKGLTVMTGEPGTGKSLLSRRILENLEEELFESGLMVAVKGAAGRGSFLARFASALGIEKTSDEPGPLMGQIFDALAVVREDGRHAVLIVDEAMALSADAFAEVAALLNLEYENRRLVSILLVGAPELDLMLGREAGLMQRVDVRVRLRPLGLEESARYLEHRIRTAGGSPAILPQEAVQALYKFSRGRPRLLNTLADNALFEAFLGSRTAAAARDVERAAGDLGIGADPGTTHTEFSDDLDASDADPVLGTLTDPDRGPALRAGAPEPGELTGLGSMDEGLTRIELGDDDDEELLELEADPGDSMFGATRLAGPGEGVGSAAGRRGSPEAEATRIAFADELPEAEPASEGEIDDLFVELLDD